MSGKKNDDRQGKEKKFLKLPEYPGGKEAFQKFVKENLKYPTEALEKRIQGTVHVRHWVDGNGKVTDAEVTHGIGHGCDEEALRIVRMLRYGKVKNRGVKLKASMRTRIEFRLPPRPAFNYSYKQQQVSETPVRRAGGNPDEQSDTGKQEQGQRVGHITYTIRKKES